MSRVPAGRLLLLLLLFVALTMPLAWLWLEQGERIYIHLLRQAAGPIYDALGLRHQRGGPVVPRLVSVVPFVVLMAPPLPASTIPPSNSRHASQWNRRYVSCESR